MTERRRQVLDAARRLFHQYGPHKTTVSDIARAAGVGVGTIYLEFRNKDAILLALSEAGHSRVLEATRAAWHGQGTSERRLRNALEARLDAFLELAESSMHGADLLHCGSCEPVQEAHRVFCETEHGLFAGFVAEGVSAGAFAAADPPATARALLLAYRAFSPPALFLRHGTPEQRSQELRADIQVVHDLVFPGLLSR